LAQSVSRISQRSSLMAPVTMAKRATATSHSQNRGCSHKNGAVDCAGATQMEMLQAVPEEQTDVSNRRRSSGSRFAKGEGRKARFGWSAASTGRMELEKQSVPGPGEYSVKDSRSCKSSAVLSSARGKPSWLLGSKTTVGPGMYDLKPMIGEGPRCSLAPKPRDPRPNEAPGPGHYHGLEHTIAAAAQRDLAIYI